MGLSKAALGSVGGVLADQWKEYFYCEAIPAEVLATKGQKRVSGRSSNTKCEDNIISNGSVIAIAEERKDSFVPSNDIQKAIGRIAVLADCAHSLGAVKNGTNAGNIADFSSFSFTFLHAYAIIKRNIASKRYPSYERKAFYPAL